MTYLLLADNACHQHDYHTQITISGRAFRRRPYRAAYIIIDDD